MTPTNRRRIRICYFNPWGNPLEDALTYATRFPAKDLGAFVADPKDAGLLQKARLDRDWYTENTRCFAKMTHPELEFLPAQVVGLRGLAQYAQAVATRASDEERWLLFMGQTPASLGQAATKLCTFLRRQGGRILFYAFDEASRTMPVFNALAPHLDLLIHDEDPLAESGRQLLASTARTVCRSWVANVEPFAVPFNESPEEKILFLGSQLGLSAHRQRQIAFLSKRFGARFVAIHDHSVAVADRAKLNAFKVGLCPEGRKFSTPGMSRTHTDRPFWSGCLGLVPVSEDSARGGRLEELQRENLILRYPHGDLAALAATCERGLAMSNGERRRMYEHFNRHETVGTVVAAEIYATPVGRGEPRAEGAAGREMLAR
jgi:hypothetical protein